MRRFTVALAVAVVVLSTAYLSHSPAVLAATPHATGWAKIYTDKHAYTYTDVACSGTHECVVTGYLLSGKKPGSEIGQSTTSGSRWTWTTLPAVQLSSVACVTLKDCFAVGRSITSGDAVAELSTDGGLKWSTMSVPKGDPELNSVSCTTTCLAVGGEWGVGADGPGVVLKLVHSGTAWSWTSETLPTGVGGLALTGVACETASLCFAVGQNGVFDPSTDEPWSWFLDESTNGGVTWTYNATVSGFGFAGVTCPTRTSCLVLEYVVGTNEWLSTNNFQSDTSVFTDGGGFSSVACSTATSCVLTGYGSTLNDATSYEGHSPEGPWTALPVLSGVNGLTASCELRGPCLGVTGFLNGTTGSIYRIL